MSAEEKLKDGGFRKQDESGGDSCLFCNYYHLSNDKTEARCNLYGVKFWNDFEASEHVCNKFDGSMLDSLLNAVAEENSRSATSDGQKHNVQASQKEGCYIATAVYGNYDAPEVLILRTFRDTVLKRTKLGRLFIKIYYAISPQLACKLKNYPCMNNKVKLILDRVVCWISDKKQ